ncbi:natural killer cell receptor 2B4-like isoform X3, partial [Clarias magur]
MLLNILAVIRTLRTLLLLLCSGDETVTLQEAEGTTITLHTGITGIQSDAQILWFYGPEKAEEKKLISQVFKGETVTEISERFKERLQLDRISGALTIRNISRNHSGVYLLQVLTPRLSSRTFSVSVYAGDETVTLQEAEGTTITLHTGITGIQSDAQILWFYGPEKAEKKILNSQVFEGRNVTQISERFKERLQLDRISGALTIRNISRNHSGVYLLHVINGGLSSRTFSVSVYAGDETVTLQEVEGTTITLHTGITGIQSDAQILWLFGPEKAEEKIFISQVFKGETVTDISGRFKERLQLDRISGALTIRNISRNHSGVDLLQVLTRRLLSRTFSVSVHAGDETVTLQEVEGTTITLHTGITGIQSDAQILWLFGPEKAEEKIFISQVFKGETVTDISGRFKERLQLDRISGALTIRNISRNHSGVDLLQVLTRRLLSRTFSVSVH